MNHGMEAEESANRAAIAAGPWPRASWSLCWQGPFLSLAQRPSPSQVPATSPLDSESAATGRLHRPSRRC